MERLNLIPFTDMKKVYQRIEEVGRIDNMAAEERLEYERALKAYRDYNNQMLTAKETGYNEGHEDGRAEGRAEGEQSAYIAIIRQFRADGKSDAEIATLLHMPEEDIKRYI